MDEKKNIETSSDSPRGEDEVVPVVEHGQSTEAEESEVSTSDARGDDASRWMNFRSWLKNHMESAATADDCVEQEEEEQLQQNAVPVSTSEAKKGSPILLKDCRHQSGLMTGVGGSSRARQEMTVMLGAPGMAMDKCPIVPSKAINSVMSSLYEPLVKIEVGVLTRHLESPTRLKPRGFAGRGTLSLFMLPDESLSLVYQSVIAKGTDEVVKNSGSDFAIVDMLKCGMRNVRNVEYASAEVSMWEELARFPRWREIDQSPIVTIHMLKGDKSGRSFYVMSGKDTEPPQLPMSDSGKDRFDTFQDEHGPSKSCDKRFYFWLSSSKLDDSVHALGKMKAYIKRPPSLAKISGVPEQLLARLSDWLVHVEEANRSNIELQTVDAKLFDSETKSLTSNKLRPKSKIGVNPLNYLGVVLARQIPIVFANCSPVSNGDALESTASVTANANALFKKYDITCPCRVSVLCNLVLSGQPVSSADTKESSSELSFVTSSEARCLSEDFARKTVENIGKDRIESLICEDLVQTARKQKLQLKADRQRKKDLEKGYQALEAAQPLIKKAVASAIIGRKLTENDRIQYISPKHTCTTQQRDLPSLLSSPAESMTESEELGTILPDLDAADSPLTCSTRSPIEIEDKECNLRNSLKVADVEQLLNEDKSSSSGNESRKISLSDLSELFDSN